MNIRLGKKVMLWSSLRNYFSKSSNEGERNENYLRTKAAPSKVVAKESKVKEIREIAFDDKNDLRFVLLGNVLFMSGIPFAPVVSVGMCLLNGGMVLSRLGQETKKYLLLLNNDQLQSISAFRPLNTYLRLIVTHSICLAAQSFLLAAFTMGPALMFNMAWLSISVQQKLLPSYFLLALIPLFLSIFINFFGPTISDFLLSKSQSQPQKPK